MSTRKFRLRKARKDEEVSEKSADSTPEGKVESTPELPPSRRRTASSVTPGVAENAVERRRSFEQDLMAIANMSTDDLDALMFDSAPSLEVGAKVVGTVTRLGKEYAWVDVGQKAEATIEVQDIPGAGVGDAVEAWVMHASDDNIRLSRSLRGSTAAAFLAEAEQSGMPVEGEVIGTNPGGLVVRFGTVRGFCPASHAGDRGTDLAALVGRTLAFEVTDASGAEPVLSRRNLLAAGRDERAREFFDAVEPGQRFEGTVVSVQDFGAFVDIDGVQGLVHRSELSWERGMAPSQVVSVGQTLPVVVLDVDPVARKLSLSARDAGASPWSLVGSQFQVGAVYEGVVDGVTDFGCFVKLAPGLSGLLHHSRSGGSRPRKGDTVKVRLDGVDVERQRLELASPDTEAAAGPEGSPAASTSAGSASFGTLGDLLGGLKLPESS